MQSYIAKKRRGTWLYATTAALSLAGTLVERLALVEAGKSSARDPLAYQELTKGAPGEAQPDSQHQAVKAPTTSGYSEGVGVSDYQE